MATIEFSVDDTLESPSRRQLEHEVRRQLHGTRFWRQLVGQVFAIECKIGDLTVTVPVTLESISDDSLTLKESTSLAVRVRQHDKTHPDFQNALEGVVEYVHRSGLIDPTEDNAVTANAEIEQLVGVPARQVVNHISMLLAGAEPVENWSTRRYGRVIKALSTLKSWPRLVLLVGDPGTGKSATLKWLPGAAAATIRRPVMFVQLSERIRGLGVQGRAGRDLSETLATIVRAANARDTPTLILIDEADAIVSQRPMDDTGSGAQENLALVDAVLVALDTTLAQNQLPVVVVLATNLGARIDPAVVRRARVFEYMRPSVDDYSLLVDNFFADLFNRPERSRLAAALQARRVPLTPADVIGQVFLAAVVSAAQRDVHVSVDELLHLAANARPTSQPAPPRTAPNEDARERRPWPRLLPVRPRLNRSPPPATRR